MKGIMSILPELQRRQQVINESRRAATTTSSILEEEVEENDEEEDDSWALDCDGDSLLSPTAANSSVSSSNRSTPAKVSAASAHGSKSGPQVMRGKNGIRQMTVVAGKLCGDTDQGSTTTTPTTGDASLEVNNKIVNILKGQENHVCNKNQTS